MTLRRTQAWQERSGLSGLAACRAGLQKISIVVGRLGCWCSEAEKLHNQRLNKASEIDPIYYDKLYYLVPLRAAAKPYALLREALRRSKRVGIAQLVLRTRAHLAALRVHNDALMVNLLRFEHELRSPDELKLPAAALGSAIKQELELAGKLIDGMTSAWKQFHDAYRENLLALIEKKRRSGPHSTAEGRSAKAAKPKGEIIDLMAQLKRSLSVTEKPAAKKAAKPQAKKKKAKAG